MNKLDHYFCQEKQYERLKADYLKHKSLIVAVDFDNTLFDLHGLGSSHELVKQLVRDCKKVNFKTFIYSASAKERYPEIEEFLKRNDIPFDGINSDIGLFFRKYPDRDYTESKLYYNILLCDRAGLLSAYETLRRLVDNIIAGDI